MTINFNVSKVFLLFAFPSADRQQPRGPMEGPLFSIIYADGQTGKIKFLLINFPQAVLST